MNYIRYYYLNCRVLVFLLVLYTTSSCHSIEKLGKTAVNHEIIDFLSTYLPETSISPDDPVLFDSISTAPATYQLKLSEPWWLIPSPLLPPDVIPLRSNNNVSINIFNNRLYLAFRTGPTHFASSKTGMYIISTADGTHWKKEFELFLKRDLREPFLIPIDGKLRFYCFAAGENMLAFQPEFVQMYSTAGNGKWEGPVEVLTKGEVHWSILNRHGKTFMTSYAGSHYQLKGEAQVSLYFKQSISGTDWSAVGDSAEVYFGGVSETAFEFDTAGNLWGVTRLEDGDKTGFGSHVVFAPANDLAKWEFPDHADPNCYMSPKMFRHGNELYLIARRQSGRQPFGQAGSKRSMTFQRLVNWVGYSLTPKTTAIFRINQEKRTVEWVMDIPGAGDTAFPSVIRLNAHQFMIANYSSDPRKSNKSWLGGQLGSTGIYMQILSFEKQ